MLRFKLSRVSAYSDIPGIHEFDEAVELSTNSGTE